MLKILLPEVLLNEGDHDEVRLPAIELRLEHSLVSLSKWEQIHEKAFFKREQITSEETASYIEQMLLSDPPPGDWISRFSAQQFQEVTNYINSKRTATWFREDQSQKGSTEVITNELIYYWMISFQIPFDPCETWHVNHLMTLIKVCGVKQTKPKRMTRHQQAEEYRRLNAERRRDLGTTG